MAEEAAPRPPVGVVVVGDVAHVIVHPELPELRDGDLPQALAHVDHVLVGRRRAVEPPDDHRDLADLAPGDPADLVLVIPRGDPRRTAEIAPVRAGEPGAHARNPNLIPVSSPDQAASRCPRAPPRRATWPGART